MKILNRLYESIKSYKNIIELKWAIFKHEHVYELTFLLIYKNEILDGNLFSAYRTAKRYGMVGQYIMEERLGMGRHAAERMRKLMSREYIPLKTVQSVPL